jgi:uncharacterized protein YxjI
LLRVAKLTLFITICFLLIDPSASEFTIYKENEEINFEVNGKVLKLKVVHKNLQVFWYNNFLHDTNI